MSSRETSLCVAAGSKNFTARIESKKKQENFLRTWKCADQPREDGDAQGNESALLQVEQEHQAKWCNSATMIELQKIQYVLRISIVLLTTVESQTVTILIIEVTSAQRESPA